MQVKIVVPVWGIDYIETFIKLSLPSQLSENNLPLISKKYKVEYVIYTLKSNEFYFHNSESIENLKQFANVRIETINKFKTRHTYGIYGQIHYKELKSSSKQNESVFLINADFIFSDGFFDQTLDQINKGWKVINIICPRANLVEVESSIIPRFSKTSGVIQIKSKNLVDIFLKNVHEMIAYHMLPKLDEDDFLPSSLIWRSKSGSLYIRNFHFHPVLINPYLKSLKKINLTIDDGYVLDNFDKKEIHYQKNGNDYFAIELSSKSLRYEPIGTYGDFWKIYYYFFGQNKKNFINFKEEVTVGEITEEEINEFIMQSEKEINRLTLHFLYDLDRLKMMRFKALFNIYRLLAFYIVRKKQYIPSFILMKLENGHKLIVRKYFRIQKS